MPQKSDYWKSAGANATEQALKAAGKSHESAPSAQPSTPPQPVAPAPVKVD